MWSLLSDIVMNVWTVSGKSFQSDALFEGRQTKMHHQHGPVLIPEILDTFVDLIINNVNLFGDNLHIWSINNQSSIPDGLPRGIRLVVAK